MDDTVLNAVKKVRLQAKHCSDACPPLTGHPDRLLQAYARRR